MFDSLFVCLLVCLLLCFLSLFFVFAFYFSFSFLSPFSFLILFFFLVWLCIVQNRVAFYSYHAAIFKLSSNLPLFFASHPFASLCINGPLRRQVIRQVLAQGHLHVRALRRCSALASLFGGVFWWGCRSGSGGPKTKADKIGSSCHKVCGSPNV